jgi:hypothetical protein
MRTLTWETSRQGLMIWRWRARKFRKGKRH